MLSIGRPSVENYQLTAQLVTVILQTGVRLKSSLRKQSAFREKLFRCKNIPFDTFLQIAVN